MQDKNTLAATLARYFSAFKMGELTNEPARLLCEFFQNELGIDDKQESMNEIANWLNSVSLSSVGGNSSFAGVRVILDIDKSIVEYGRGEDYTWLTADELIELAELAEESETPAPAPDWFDNSWYDITFDFAKQYIEKMNYAEVIAYLEKLNVPIRFEGENTEFRFGCEWTNNPKMALLDWIENYSPQRLANIFRRS